MINLVASIHGALDRVEIPEIASYDLDRQASQRTQVRVLARKHAHAIAACEQGAHDVASHESVAAGDQC
jgi:hypothetical protein